MVAVLSQPFHDFVPTANHPRWHDGIPHVIGRHVSDSWTYSPGTVKDEPVIAFPVDELFGNLGADAKGIAVVDPLPSKPRDRSDSAEYVIANDHEPAEQQRRQQPPWPSCGSCSSPTSKHLTVTTSRPTRHSIDSSTTSTRTTARMRRSTNTTPNCCAAPTR